MYKPSAQLKKNIITLINLKKLKQADVARALNITPQAVGKYFDENAPPVNARIDSLPSFANALGVKPWELIMPEIEKALESNISPEIQAVIDASVKAAVAAAAPDALRERIKTLEGVLKSIQSDKTTEKYRRSKPTEAAREMKAKDKLNELEKIKDDIQSSSDDSSDLIKNK